MKKAGYKDKDIITEILSSSFINDPHINWMLSKSKNKNKVKILMDYIFEETFRIGEIYLNEDKTAAALWNYEKKEKLSLNLIFRNLNFLFRIGRKATSDIIKMEKQMQENYPSEDKFCRLCIIGVLPHAQGKGHASALMNPMLEIQKNKSIPVYLETANLKNIEIYKKKGFGIYNSIAADDFTLYLMRK